MKKLLILAGIVMAAIYTIECTGLLGLTGYKPSLAAGMQTNEYVLEWPRVSYPAYYEVEVLNAPPEDDQNPAPRFQRIARFHTFKNQFPIDQDFPFRTYWRVAARGLFAHPLGRFSESVNLAEVMGVTAQDFQHIKPMSTSPAPANDPAPGVQPTVTWTVVPGAVYYEFELLSAPPENPNGIDPSRYQLLISREVFTNGYNLDLEEFPGDHFYWRVRALDYDGNPLGVFSDASELWINRSQTPPLKPSLSVSYNEGGMPPLLYPVYSWIPLTGAISYEVELLDQEPENPNGTEPSIHRMWSKEVIGFDCYDDLPRAVPGTYYWRVHGLDALGRPVGVYSDTGKLVVDPTKGNYSATFGDSITHGGGAISYSPADWEYDYQSYLNFPTVNLGKSGDTSETMAERFEQDVLPFKPRYLIIMGGSNSLRGGIPAGDVIRDLTLIRDKCILYGIRPIFLTLPPINPPAISRAFNEDTMPDWQDQFAAVNRFIRQQRYYIDLAPFFVDSNGELPDRYAIDGLHLDIEGKKLMAQIINSHWARVTR